MQSSLTVEVDLLDILRDYVAGQHPEQCQGFKTYRAARPPRCKCAACPALYAAMQKARTWQGNTL